MEQLQDVRKWMSTQSMFAGHARGDEKRKPGFKVLFDGSSRSDKTKTAEMLSKEFNKEIYRVDLSHLVSKYISETEKNLSRVFDNAERNGSILFFDEADALFGKRTGVKDSHDRYANQEVSYLLQRIEEYPGLVIVAANRSNIDHAFLRRFNSVISFSKA